MAVQILPGIDEYLRPGIQKLGDTISLFTETDRRTQKAIRNMLIENPSLIQQFADLEYKTPGSLKKMGFGSVSDMISGVGPSMELQSEERYGQQKLDLEGRTLGLADKQLDVAEKQTELEGETTGLELVKSNILKGLMQANPNLSPEQAEAAVANFMGVPTAGAIEDEGFARDVAELNSLRAKRITEMLVDGLKTEGPMWSYVAKARAGQDNPMETASILADPVRAEIFDRLWKLQGEREALINKETGNEPTQIWDLPVAVQQQYTNIAPARASMGLYALKVNSYMQKAYGTRLAGKLKISSDENIRLAGEIKGMKSALMGTLRPLLSPGPLSKADMDMLDQMLGSVLALRPDEVAGQLEASLQFFDGKIQGLTTTYPKVQVPRIPSSEIPRSLIDLLKESGMTEQEGRDYMYRMGYDVGGNSYSPARDTIATTIPPNTNGIPPEIMRYLQQFIQGGGGR